MIVPSTTLQFKPLRLAANSNDYALYKAALEWDLTEPIVLESREDMRSEKDWHNRLEPYRHQVSNLITFCRRLPVTLLADDVGLGKTISAGLIVSELIARNRISKILIVCPKLLMPQWKEELDVKFGIPAAEAIGGHLRGARVPGEFGAVITTYNSARLHFDALEEAGFEMLILDEAHKLRNLYGVDPPPQVAVRFREALAKRLFRYVLMLTATPIHNRLWDLYSLIDLLTVARGHENPFGSEGMFARDYIADERTRARQLNPQKRDAFRSIVYGYMSRVRRSDANLHFPERIVQLHKVAPTPAELEITELISGPIQNLNALSQISILQALVSSPHALAAQLDGMARRGTVSASLAGEVRATVNKLPTIAKLVGLGSLLDQLEKERQGLFRAVIFTTRRETQTLIEAFLQQRRIPCGIINGESGTRNQATISAFKKNPPQIKVIVSTEAGSEGINLQAANILINFDLPWNPMVVEQRIGRIQRLASDFASVCIFNVVLTGTFEEYIVGRLMEKLQMAASAIGDVEALLEAADLDGNEDNSSKSFEDRIRQLVIASLAGRNVEAATASAAKSIADAKSELERETKNINTLLGGMDGANDSGPRCPSLTKASRSMDSEQFVVSALMSQGARVTLQSNGSYLVDFQGKREIIRTDTNAQIAGQRFIPFGPGTTAFQRLVSKVVSDCRHYAIDDCAIAADTSEVVSRNWVSSFHGTFVNSKVSGTSVGFTGQALLRIRASVAHDSYERLIELECADSDQTRQLKITRIEPIGNPIRDPEVIGLAADKLIELARQDPDVVEFCRFYQDRKVVETAAALGDERKRKKLEDEFTPRVEMSLVGLRGLISRFVVREVKFTIDDSNEFACTMSINLTSGKLHPTPEMAKCHESKRIVPLICLEKCEVSKAWVLSSLLTKSEISHRKALFRETVVCSLTGKRVLRDEVETSDVTGNTVIRSLLKTSSLSGKKGEPQYFVPCYFSKTEVLEHEIDTSQISGKKYRIDEKVSSSVSGKTGHKLEFISCFISKKPLLPDEAEKCAQTGKVVMPGLLEQCEVTLKSVLPTELEKCSVTGKRALRRLFVSSNISKAMILENEAVKSIDGKFCSPLEALTCDWSGRLSYPDDIKTCTLTGLSLYSAQLTRERLAKLRVLQELLDGTSRLRDMEYLWPSIIPKTKALLGSRNCEIQAATVSPNGKNIALCIEVRKWMGLKARYAGMIFAIETNSAIGRIVIGKRNERGWFQE